MVVGEEVGCAKSAFVGAIGHRRAALVGSLATLAATDSGDKEADLTQLTLVGEFRGSKPRVNYPLPKTDPLSTFLGEGQQERQFRAKSNRMFERIATSMPTEVLLGYGYTPKIVDPLVTKLEQAYRHEDWA